MLWETAVVSESAWRSTFALRATVDILRLLERGARWLAAANLRVNHERRMACHPKLAHNQASEGWYRYGDSNPGPVAENHVS